MNTTVWKYRLYTIGLTQYVPMPMGAQVLRLELQNGEPMLWAQVEPGAPERSRAFQFIGTGHPTPPNSGYVGTVQLEGGALVLHLFETRL